MTNFTKQAIKETFLKLLNERPLTQISVREIVTECGINRNSFYYHFHDIPSLIEEIVMDAADGIIKKYPSITSIDEAMEAAFRFSLDNKKAILHICNSINKNIYERYMMRICEYVVTTYFDTVFAETELAAEDKSVAIMFMKCELFGLTVDWINNGMSEDAIVKLKQLLVICNGLTNEIIDRCRNLER